jgi:hypothetical protein
MEYVMSLKAACFSTLLASTFLCQPIFATQNNTMTFKNKRGSLLELNLQSDNQVSGFFTTAVASKTCPDAIGTKRPIVGYMVGNAVTFSVVYPMCQSVLSVTGNFTKNQEKIDTLSLLNHQASDITHEGPGARFIGHDTYKKIN